MRVEAFLDLNHLEVQVTQEAFDETVNELLFSEHLRYVLGSANDGGEQVSCYQVRVDLHQVFQEQHLAAAQWVSGLL